MPLARGSVLNHIVKNNMDPGENPFDVVIFKTAECVLIYTKVKVQESLRMETLQSIQEALFSIGEENCFTFSPFNVSVIILFKHIPSLQASIKATHYKIQICAYHYISFSIFIYFH